MSEHSNTPEEIDWSNHSEEDDWSEERYEAEMAVVIARETYMFDACPDTCDDLQEAYHDAQKALAALIRKESAAV